MKKVFFFSEDFKATFLSPSKKLKLKFFFFRFHGHFLLRILIKAMVDLKVKINRIFSLRCVTFHILTSSSLCWIDTRYVIHVLLLFFPQYTNQVHPRAILCIFSLSLIYTLCVLHFILFLFWCNFMLPQLYEKKYDANRWFWIYFLFFFSSFLFEKICICWK